MKEKQATSDMAASVTEDAEFAADGVVSNCSRATGAALLVASATATLLALRHLAVPLLFDVEADGWLQRNWLATLVPLSLPTTLAAVVLRWFFFKLFKHA